MRFTPFMPAFALMLLVSGCGSAKEDNQVTETRMDNLDSLEGTISDDMINTDELSDEPPMEAAPVEAEALKTPGKKPDAAEVPDREAPAAEKNTDSSSDAQ